MKVEINEETYQNLKHCVERTAHMWVPFTDLWPFEIMDIIKQYEAYTKKCLSAPCEFCNSRECIE